MGSGAGGLAVGTVRLQLAKKPFSVMVAKHMSGQIQIVAFGSEAS